MKKLLVRGMLLAALTPGFLSVGATSSDAGSTSYSLFTGDWYAHTSSLVIGQHHIARESIGDGCCDQIVTVRMRLYDARGTRRFGSIGATVTAVHFQDASSWSGPKPYVGERGRIRVRAHVLHEPFTNWNYCDSTAETTSSQCGA